MHNANILMLFAPSFKQFGCDVAKEYLRRNGGGKVYGLCTGLIEVKRYVEKELGEDVGHVWYLPAEEKTWLQDDELLKNISLVEQELGPGAVGRIMVADRRVGRGFVRGGVCRPDHIGRYAVRNATTFPQTYVAGLYMLLDKVLRQAKPDCVFLYAVAGAPALALAEICKARGIFFCRLNTPRIGNQYLIDTDPRGRLECVAKSYHKAVEGNLDLAGILPQAKKLLQSFQNNPIPPGYTQRNLAILNNRKPWRTTILALKGNLKYLIKSFIQRRDYSENIRRNWFKALVEWKRKFVPTKYFSSPPSANRPFIYYPLHVEPEASTMVLSPWHTNQESVIEALAKSAPADMLIVVKEHAPMLGLRPRGFYRAISRIPRVVLLGPEHNSLSLIQQASLVTVITGTAAWEAIRLHKPALVIGDSPFLVVGEGVIHEPCLARLAEAISKALNTPPASDLMLALYIAACLSESFEMSPSILWDKYEDHPQNERQAAVNNIVEGILKRECETV